MEQQERKRTEARLDELERRVEELEKQQGEGLLGEREAAQAPPVMNDPNGLQH